MLAIKHARVLPRATFGPNYEPPFVEVIGVIRGVTHEYLVGFGRRGRIAYAHRLRPGEIFYPAGGVPLAVAQAAKAAIQKEK